MATCTRQHDSTLSLYRMVAFTVQWSPPSASLPCTPSCGSKTCSPPTMPYHDHVACFYEELLCNAPSQHLLDAESFLSSGQVIRAQQNLTLPISRLRSDPQHGELTVQMARN